MNLNENRRVRNPEYIDVQSGWDYLRKVARLVWQGYAVHVRVNGETKKGYFLALTALLIARLGQRPAFLTYGGGHQQSYFPAPKGSLWHLAFSLLFRIPHRIYCNSPAVKNALLTTGISEDSVEPIPHFSSGYVEFDAAPLPSAVEDFYRGHEAIFFNYVCFRKEFALDFLAEAVRSFRAAYPRIGFLLVGPWDREMDAMKTFLREQKLEDAVCVLGSVPHNVFLTLLSRSLAYIRTPVTDGICSSVLESLKLKVPVLAVDNGTRPAGTRLWLEGNLESLLALMTEAVKNHAAMVAEIPEIILEDNIKKLADSIERVGLRHKRMNGNYGWQAESGDMGYARLSPVIGDMAIDKGRFGFGRNWQRFLRVLDEERIREAEKSLCEMLRVSNLSGRSFLDVGCGSGIFSLAAMRLGASRVHSFDYDPESVACAHELKSRFFRSVARWTIERGDALDKNYVASLGTYDVVYSWGVLHHTGNLWQAMDNVLPRVADAGKLFLAIYNDAGKKSRRWCRLKKLYNSGAPFPSHTSVSLYSFECGAACRGGPVKSQESGSAISHL